MRKRAIVLLLGILIVSGIFASSSRFIPFVETEQGLISVLSHTYQNGTSEISAGTDFDFRNNGGQEIAFPFSRYVVGATIANTHRAWLTYQPLRLETNVTFRDAVTIGNVLFAAGSQMDLLYSFPFYRFSYTYDVLSKHAEADVGIGLALQIRNASIVFEKVDGTAQYVSQNLGFVPALVLYSRYEFPFGLVLSAEITGIYTYLKGLNGANFTFEGSILDASLRMGYLVGDDVQLFGNLRFFGGTANGTSGYEVDAWTEPTTRYTKNNIAAITVSVGVNKSW